MPQIQAKKHAWLDQVLQDHDTLKGLLAELREFLDAPRPEIGVQGQHTWAATCAIRLVELHDGLFRHFRFEENDGMLRDLAECHPRALPQIESLEREHGQMLDSLRCVVADVLRYSEGKPPEDARIRSRIGAILDQLDAHESTETDFIQRLMYRDCGAAD
jgi:hypothetical protein